jgi:hypothetical protein
VRKSGLMGFCDVAPGQRKVLAIRFLHNSKPFRYVEGQGYCRL